LFFLPIDEAIAPSIAPCQCKKIVLSINTFFTIAFGNMASVVLMLIKDRNSLIDNWHWQCFSCLPIWQRLARV